MSPAALLLLFSVYVSIAEAFVLDHSSSRTVTNILTVTNGGPWGTWHSPQFCASGSFAVGYSMRIEGNQHGSDDTSLNAVKLLCKTRDGDKYGGEIYSGEGVWGSWTSQVKCDPLEFISTFALQVEGDQHGGDDTAANYAKFKCRTLESKVDSYELAVPPGVGMFGSYGSWSQSCNPNTAVCGISTRVESDQHGGDDTALNDVKLYCCSD